MKTLLIGLLVVLLLVAIGWLSFSRTPDKANIHVETEKIQKDTEEMVESGKDFINRADEEGEASTDLDQEEHEEYEKPAPNSEPTNGERPLATEPDEALQQKTEETSEASS